MGRLCQARSKCLAKGDVTSRFPKPQKSRKYLHDIAFSSSFRVRTLFVHNNRRRNAKRYVDHFKYVRIFQCSFYYIYIYICRVIFTSKGDKERKRVRQSYFPEVIIRTCTKLYIPRKSHLPIDRIS